MRRFLSLPTPPSLWRRHALLPFSAEAFASARPARSARTRYSDLYSRFGRRDLAKSLCGLSADNQDSPSCVLDLDLVGRFVATMARNFTSAIGARAHVCPRRNLFCNYDSNRTKNCERTVGNEFFDLLLSGGIAVTRVPCDSRRIDFHRVKNDFASCIQRALIRDDYDFSMSIFACQPTGEHPFARQTGNDVVLVTLLEVLSM